MEKKTNTHSPEAENESNRQDPQRNQLTAALLARQGAALSALMSGARAVLEVNGFAAAARAIFDLCKDLVGASAGYVALLADTGEENEVLFLDAGGRPCSVDPNLPMPIRGLRAEAYHRNQTVYDNDFMNSPWADFMPGGHVPLKNVMFAPLVIDGRTVGIIGLANKAGDFTEDDARMAGVFGELAAIALQNSRNFDLRNQAEAEKSRVIAELQRSLAEIKTLRGLIPICAHCKKIRDDQGLWNRIEAYVARHSHAEFSHGICPDCLRTHYGDLGIGADDGGDA